MTLLQRVPNLLTLSRIVLTVFFLFFIYSSEASSFIALLIFTVASLTDYYDGKLARRLNSSSHLGAFLDPLADKILIMGAFISFVGLKLIPAWMVIIILAREFLITGLRLVAAGFDRHIPASRLAKHKTLSQVIAVYLILIFMVFKDFNRFKDNLELFHGIIIVFMYLTIALTVFSGLAYFRSHSYVFGKRKNS